MKPNENQEAKLQELAEAHNKAALAIKAVAADYAEREQALREEMADDVAAAVNAEAQTRVALYNAVAESDESLWQKLKTRVVGLVKYGWRKAPGQVIVADEETTAALIRKHAKPAEVAALLRVKTTVDKTALRKMPAEFLAKIGAELRADTDEIIVQENLGDAGKLIKQMREDSWKNA